jgi:hypothetical protein
MRLRQDVTSRAEDFSPESVEVVRLSLSFFFEFFKPLSSVSDFMLRWCGGV